jgi:hypothetical protein
MRGSDDTVPAARLARDRELSRQGWLRRFTASPPRLVELRDLYETLGQDVLLDPMLPDELPSRCEGCTLALTLFRVIYTRPGAQRGMHEYRHESGQAGEGRS